MLARVSINTIRPELLGKARRCQRFISRSILTSNSSFPKHHLASSENDVIVQSPHPALHYPNFSIDQYVWKDLSKWSHKPALVDGITERSVSYAQLRDRCRALAVRLQSVFRLSYGETIAVCLPNSIEFPIVCLAGFEAGMIVTTVNPIYTAEEISKQLLNSNAKLVFGLASMSSVLQRAIAMTKQPIKVIYSREQENDAIPADGIKIDDLLSTKGIDLSSQRNSERDPHEVAVLPYSSGTTGQSKGVMLSHKNVVSNCIMINSSFLTSPAIGDRQDVLPCVLPFFHIYGFVCSLMSKLQHGCKLVTLPRFMPETYLNVLEKHPSTLLYLAPPIIIFMSNSERVQEQHTRSISAVMSGAAPLGASDVERFSKKSPNAKLFQGYGLTEAAPVVLISSPGSKNYASVGYLTPDTEGKIVRLDDPEGLGVGPNVKGELWVRGPQVMIGYHNNEQATKDTVTADGWLKTGDIGYYDENQEFYITDRLKELIKVKGFQVPPAELEEILRDHPDIADAAVIGIPHPIAGEFPRAYVVSKNPGLTEKEVKKYVAQKVAEYKRLEGGVEFIAAIPKNATGKILRRELKKKFESS